MSQLLESLNMVLVVGLSVDYCVHLAEGYARSVSKRRKDKVYESLTQVGVSVISGAFTTLGSSLFLVFAQILFFVQFSTFMFCTIGFSIFFSLGLFVTMLATFGPEGNFGSFSFKSKCCKKKG